ncbi:MAG: hypothetical protein RLZZ381_2225 [Cyanobacteriota bacterium]|jgi:uncharacterized iron-regulated membrane protein
MSTKRIRNLAFTIHRYLGLALGLLITLIGITGSLLVFEQEIDSWLVNQQIETITPQAEIVSSDRTFKTVQAAYPDWKIDSFSWNGNEKQPLKVNAIAPNSQDEVGVYLHGIHTIFVNPYTGKILSDRAERFSYYRFLLNLHYRLFIPGDTGMYATGIAGLLLFVMAITGIILWPGWRNFQAGFKIKWNAHIKRRNFDLHKVTGIIAATFLGIIAITGFLICFYNWSVPITHAVTFSPQPNNEEETLVVNVNPQSDSSRAKLDILLQQAIKALPDLQVGEIYVPASSTDPVEVYSKSYAQTIYLDPYTAKVLKIQGSSQEKSLGDRLVNSWIPLHFGTFGGLSTRILYVFVGLSPTILFTTALIMYRLRRRPEFNFKGDP